MKFKPADLYGLLTYRFPDKEHRELQTRLIPMQKQSNK